MIVPAARTHGSDARRAARRNNKLVPAPTSAAPSAGYHQPSMRKKRAAM